MNEKSNAKNTMNLRVITPQDTQRQADKQIGDYAARMWLAGVDIHLIDMRLSRLAPAKKVRRNKVAA